MLGTSNSAGKQSLKRILAGLQKKIDAAPRIVKSPANDSHAGAGHLDASAAAAIEVVTADSKTLQRQDSAGKSARVRDPDKTKDSVVSPKSPKSRVTTADSAVSKPVDDPVPVPKSSRPKKQKVPIKISKSRRDSSKSGTMTTDTRTVLDGKSKSLGEVLTQLGTDLQIRNTVNPAMVHGHRGRPSSKYKGKPSQLAATTAGKSSTEPKPETETGSKVKSTEGPNNPVNRYYTSIDLRGFTNDNIFLHLDERCVTIVANRPKGNGHHCRKVTEIVEIPEGVKLENLKVERTKAGYLTIEEEEYN